MLGTVDHADRAEALGVDARQRGEVVERGGRIAPPGGALVGAELHVRPTVGAPPASSPVEVEHGEPPLGQ